MSDQSDQLSEEALFDTLTGANGNVSASVAKECARGARAIQDRYEEEQKIVDILWLFFGDPSHEFLSGKSIQDLVTGIQEENKRLRGKLEAAEQHIKILLEARAVLEGKH
jgi:hypothetical protein